MRYWIAAALCVATIYFRLQIPTVAASTARR
jgi:peptidoglycan lytic transglycosylase